MSMRLSFKFTDNGKVIDCGLYRWGAYTASAADLVDFAVNCFNNDDRTFDASGRITSSKNPSKKIRSFFDDTLADFIARNKEDVASIDRYHDGSVEVDIGKKNVHFDVFSHFTDEEMQEEFGIEDKSDLYRFPSCIPFDEWEDISNAYLKDDLKCVDEDGDFITDIS